MKYVELNNVQEATGGTRMPPGGYICRITHIEDVPDKEYLKVEYDVAEGEFTGHYLRLFQNHSFWGGKYVRSYKENALPFFKRFITSIENSNSPFKFNGQNEELLKGKLIGLVIGEEEYESQTGEIKIRLRVDMERSIDNIRSGDFTVPELKRLNGSSKPTMSSNSDVPPEFFIDKELKDDDLPF